MARAHQPTRFRISATISSRRSSFIFNTKQRTKNFQSNWIAADHFRRLCERVFYFPPKSNLFQRKITPASHEHLLRPFDLQPILRHRQERVGLLPKSTGILFSVNQGSRSQVMLDELLATAGKPCPRSVKSKKTNYTDSSYLKATT